MHYLYLDPHTEVFPAEPPVDEPSPETGFLSRVLSMSGDLVESAQARELGQLVNERADLSNRLHLAMSNLPKASEHLWAFIGFFEQDFRRFDFYVGMYDALVELRASPSGRRCHSTSTRCAASDEHARRGTGRPFMCLLSLAEPEFERYRGECEGPDAGELPHPAAGEPRSAARALPPHARRTRNLRPPGLTSAASRRSRATRPRRCRA